MTYTELVLIIIAIKLWLAWVILTFFMKRPPKERKRWKC